MTAITAITAQNTLGVQAVHPVPTDMVLAQIDSVASDIGVDAVKIGMIGSAETASAVAERLSQPDLAQAALVFEPVMIASSGSVLADDATIGAFGAMLDRAMENGRASGRERGCQDGAISGVAVELKKKKDN